MKDRAKELFGMILSAFLLIFLCLFFIPVVIISISCIVLLEIPKFYALLAEAWETKYNRGDK